MFAVGGGVISNTAIAACMLLLLLMISSGLFVSVFAILEKKSPVSMEKLFGNYFECLYEKE